MNTHLSTSFAATGEANGIVEQSRNMKRVTFEGAPFSMDEDENRDPNLLRRGTPHPSKKLKESPQPEKDAAAAPPPPVFNRADSAVEYDPQTESNNDGAEAYDVAEEGAKVESGTEESQEAENIGEEANEEDDQEPTEEEKQWQTLCEEKQGQDDEVFHCFMQGQERWKAADEQLGHSLENCVTKMGEASVYAVEKLFTPIFNVEREKLHTLQTSCKKLLMGNHGRRNKFFKELEEAEKRISEDIKKLKAQTLGLEEQGDQNSDEPTPEKAKGSTVVDADAEGKMEDDEKEKALWQDLLDDPNQTRSETAQQFLNACQRLADAEERFVEATDEFQGQWKEHMESLVQFVSFIHNEEHHKYDELDSYLRFKLVETDGREKELARRLEEEERKRQAFFSSLLGRVTSKTSRFMGGLVRSSNNKK